MSNDERNSAEAAFRALNRLFARIEEIGVRIGVCLTVVGFALYVTGFVPPFLSITRLLGNWGSRVDDFVRDTGMPTGWSWLGMLGYSDMLALAGLILLSSVVIAAYLGLLLLLARQRNRAYFVLVVLQLCVFALAAMGVMGGGH